jgi:flagellar motor protein MotB
MSAIMTSPTPLLNGEVSRLLDEFAISQAAELAREGAYDRAESLLRPAVERADAPVAALDLQARVCAQQGRLGEAARWWQKVLDREPGNAAAQAALTRANALQRRPAWLQTVWPLLVGVGVLVCAALILGWQSRRQASANIVLQQRVGEVVKAEAQSGQRQVESLLTEVAWLKAAQAQAAGHLVKLDSFGTKLDGWAAAQGAVSGQLAEIQAATKRLSATQEAQAQISSNQVDSLRRTFEQELAATKDGFAQQLGIVQAEAKNVALQHLARAHALSNQVAALRSVMDREQALIAELEQGRAATEKLQSDYRTLAASHETLQAQAGLATKPPNVTIAVAGVSTSVSGNVVEITFDEGLFDHGTHFRTGAKDQLLAVAKALSQSSEPRQIQVVGFADDDRAFLKWTAQWESSLALERASAVVDHFISLGLFQSQRLSAVAGDSQKRPFASDSIRNRMKNRTAILRLASQPANLVRDGIRHELKQPITQKQ